MSSESDLLINGNTGTKYSGLGDVGGTTISQRSQSRPGFRTALENPAAGDMDSLSARDAISTSGSETSVAENQRLTIEAGNKINKFE